MSKIKKIAEKKPKDWTVEEQEFVQTMSVSEMKEFEYYRSISRGFGMFQKRTNPRED